MLRNNLTAKVGSNLIGSAPTAGITGIILLSSLLFFSGCAMRYYSETQTTYNSKGKRVSLDKTRLLSNKAFDKSAVGDIKAGSFSATGVRTDTGSAAMQQLQGLVSIAGQLNGLPGISQREAISQERQNSGPRPVVVENNQTKARSKNSSPVVPVGSPVLPDQTRNTQ